MMLINTELINFDREIDEFMEGRMLELNLG